MTAALEITLAARAAGIDAAFGATGQTGILLAGRGIAVDRVISDFVAGATEELIDDLGSVAAGGRGPGSLLYPAYPSPAFARSAARCDDPLPPWPDPHRGLRGQAVFAREFVRIYEKRLPGSSRRWWLRGLERTAPAWRPRLAAGQVATGRPAADPLHEAWLVAAIQAAAAHGPGAGGRQESRQELAPRSSI
jgi:hypothetical protein